jgi:hypothetical protein
MKRRHATRLIRVLGSAGALWLLVAFPIAQGEPSTPIVKVPGPYPYDEPVRIPAPQGSDPFVLPSPAPFPYPEPSSSLASNEGRSSASNRARRRLTPENVRKAVFKYNGVAEIFAFLAALPADVSIFDPQLGRPRPLVKRGRVIKKNVAWLRKRGQVAAHKQS